MKTWGYARANPMWLKSMNGSSIARRALWKILRDAGDEVILLHGKNFVEPYGESIGIKFGDPWDSAQCDFLIIEGADTASQIVVKPRFEGYPDSRMGNWQVAEAFRNFNGVCLLQQADPLCPVAPFPTTARPHDAVTLDFLSVEGIKFVALTESLLEKPPMPDGIRSPIQTLTNNATVPFVWNGCLGPRYLKEIFEPKIKVFEETSIACGYYGIKKFDRWDSLKLIAKKLKNRNVYVDVLGRGIDSKEDIYCAFVQELYSFEDFMKNIRVSLVITDNATRRNKIPTMRTEEACLFSTPMAIQPDYGANEVTLSQPHLLPEIISNAIPRSFLCGQTKTADEWCDRVVKLQEKKYWVNAQDEILDPWAMGPTANDIYSLIVYATTQADQNYDCAKPMEEKYITWMHARLKKDIYTNEGLINNFKNYINKND